MALGNDEATPSPKTLHIETLQMAKIPIVKITRGHPRPTRKQAVRRQNVRIRGNKVDGRAIKDQPSGTDATRAREGGR